MFYEGMGDQADDAMAQLVEGFLVNLDQILSQLMVALGQSDGTELSRLAHSLKGSSSTMGAMPLSRVCHELEMHKTDDFTEKGELVDSVLKSAETVMEVIPEWHTYLNKGYAN